MAFTDEYERLFSNTAPNRTMITGE
jgi:hypothetical protein